jgi:hypothetical protein
MEIIENNLFSHEIKSMEFYTSLDFLIEKEQKSI